MSENGLSVLSLAQNLKYIESIHARHEEEKLVQSALGLNSRQPKPKVNKKLRCPLNLKTLWEKKFVGLSPSQFGPSSQPMSIFDQELMFGYNTRLETQLCLETKFSL